MRPPLSRALTLALILVMLVMSSNWALVSQAEARPQADIATQTQAVDRALAWLRAQQRADGSFADALGVNLDTALALAATGQDAGAWRVAPGAASLSDFLATRVLSPTLSAGEVAKLSAAVAAIGMDPRAFGGVDLVARTLAFCPPMTNTFPASSGDLAWVALGLTVAREALPADLVGALLTRQSPDGGWEWSAGFGTDSNTAAAVLQALIAAGVPVTHTAIVSGTAYLATQQSPSGGFTYSSAWGTDADANSTSYGLQALVAIGQNPLAAPWLKGGKSALDDLLSMQLPSGAISAWGSANLYATVQAIPALLGKPLPLPGRIPAIRSAVSYLRTLQQPNGGMGTLGDSIQTLVALADAGEDPRQWRVGDGPTLPDFIAAQVRAEAWDPISIVGQAGQLMVALAMLNISPYSFGGVNLASVARGSYNATTGALDPNGNVCYHSQAMWGLAAWGEPLPAEAIAWLRNQQRSEGGWALWMGRETDTNSTSQAVLALLAANVPAADPVLTRALAYLHAQQTPDGGLWWDSTKHVSDANSTAMAILAVRGLGEEPTAAWSWAQTLTATNAITLTLHNPVERLYALQLPNGAFEHETGRGANPLATVQAIQALAQRAFPYPIHIEWHELWLPIALKAAAAH